MDIPSLCSLIPLYWAKDNILTASNILTTSDKLLSECLLLKSFLFFPHTIRGTTLLFLIACNFFLSVFTVALATNQRCN